MKYELKPFQANALNEMLEEAFDAQGRYDRSGKPQVISLMAPTGSGKTIIATSFIEDVYTGNEEHPDHPDAIFVWLSDSPELNEQSKIKIERTADKLRFGQCITIDADSFNQEYLEEGCIYFLNTQKLSKNSRLVRGGDGREYTFWETLQNTIEEKADRLFVIIDEAHRGMKNRGAKEAMTTMQKFIMGSPDDRLSPCPVVIGMSATSARFNALVGSANSTIRPVNISAADVRRSGLLKDHAFAVYPEGITGRADMAVLQAAADDWVKKCVHWDMFSDRQKAKRVNPIFMVQVENGSPGHVSKTDLDEVVKTIEDRIGATFGDGEILHAFGEKSALTINGRTVRYEEPSRIDENRDVKVVLFKDALTTGWDCPRAETMISFRSAQDSTYIAQLLGRMFRTPLHQRIMSDEFLNTVELFLPYFDKGTVGKILEALKDEEGGEPPTNFGFEGIGSSVSLTALPPTEGDPLKRHAPTPPVPHTNPIIDALQEIGQDGNGNGGAVSAYDARGTSAQEAGPALQQPPQGTIAERGQHSPLPGMRASAGNDGAECGSGHAGTGQVPGIIDDGIDRIGIIDYINNLGIQTYVVRRDKINDYLKSLFQLAGFLTQTGLYAKAVTDVKAEIGDRIKAYVDALKHDGIYGAEVKNLQSFTLSSSKFDVFGEMVGISDGGKYFSTTDTDIDRQFRIAEKRLKSEGAGIAYGRREDVFDINNANQYKMDVILFANSTEAMAGLMRYAEGKYHDLVDAYRSRVRTLDERQRLRYRSIVNDGDAVSSHDYYLPQSPDRNPYPPSAGGIQYFRHLYVSETTRTVSINLNGWEEGLLKEEAGQPGFVCWLRNPDRKPWSLCIPYEKGGYKDSMYPDFIVIREDGPHDYYVDILEPHDPTRTDNVGKAKGLAEYAAKYDFGRIQLIRKMRSPTGADGFKRLDMSKSEIRTRVRSISTNEELDHVFDEYGFYM